MWCEPIVRDVMHETETFGLSEIAVAAGLFNGVSSLGPTTTETSRWNVISETNIIVLITEFH